MKTIPLFVFFLTLSFGQSQDGAVAISKAIVPASETIVNDFSTCVEKLVGLKISSKEALASCKEATKVAANVATRVANEAADATKASRPIVVTSSYGYGYGRCWSCGGWGGSTVILPTSTESRRVPWEDRFFVRSQLAAERLRAREKASEERQKARLERANYR